MTRMFKQKDQSGMASFLVVTIIVTLLALVSIGFSQLANRELKQSLDRELSDQAYYAAESGINDAKNYIASTGASNSSCGLPSSPNFVNDLSNGKNIAKYTCVVIDATPTKTSFNIWPDSPVSIQVTSAQLNSLLLSWQKWGAGSFVSLGTFPNLPPEAGLDSSATGLLGVGIYPANSGDDMNALASKSKQFFLYPNSSNAPVEVVPYNNGGFVRGNCQSGATPAYCSSKISALPSASTYYVSFSAYYSPITVIMQALDSSNNAIGIPGVEASIDVTGSGNNVLRRVQTYVPLSINTKIPGYSLQSMQSICKLFRANVVTQNKYDSTVTDPSAVNPDNACFAPNGNSNDAIDNSGQTSPL